MKSYFLRKNVICKNNNVLNALSDNQIKNIKKNIISKIDNRDAHGIIFSEIGYKTKKK